MPKRKSEQESRKPAEWRPEGWSAEDKLAAVVQSRGLSETELGEFLRREGLHEEKELERELRHKEKALAETAALLVLRKKAEAVWGDEDASTESKNQLLCLNNFSRVPPPSEESPTK